MRRREPDRMLELLVNIANARTEAIEPEAEGATVTLFVGGETISGHIIPTWQWLEWFGTTFSGAAVEEVDGNPLEGVVRDERDWQAWVEGLKDSGRRLQPEEEQAVEQQKSPHFVSLGAARAWSTGNPIPAQGAMMRVRLDRVDGWFLGTLNH